MIKLSIIVAMANNRAIGRNNQLLWHLPEDLKYFKRKTMGKPLIMGRKTFESINRPLPGRLNIVVTRQRKWVREGVRVAHSVASAINIANAQACIDGVDEVMVIGGAELYQCTLPQADTLYLTRVDTDLAGDVFFPAVDDAIWQEVSREEPVGPDNASCHYVFCVLQNTERARKM